MLTPEQLQAIRERADKATPGPWACWDGWGPIRGTQMMGLKRIGPEGQVGIGGDTGLPVMRDIYATEADAEFVAAARADVPALLDHIAALEAERDRLRAMLSDVREVIANSDGVTGWHRNGDVATWDEFSWPDEIDAALQDQQEAAAQ